MLLSRAILEEVYKSIIFFIALLLYNVPQKLALPQLPCSSTGASGGMQHPLAEEIQLRASIALPLQQCQFSNLALDMPVTGGQLERGLHCRLLELQAAGEVHRVAGRLV